MGKLIFKGFRKDASNAATPTGPITLRDGRKVITISDDNVVFIPKSASDEAVRSLIAEAQKASMTDEERDFYRRFGNGPVAWTRPEPKRGK
jgi:hypothetical protein